MRNIFYAGFFSAISALALFSCGVSNFFDDPEAKMVKALQEALVLGSKTAADNLSTSCSSAKDCATGYLGNKLVEIAVPDTVKNVLDKISLFANAITAVPGLQSSALSGLSDYGDSIKVALNRGAEKAAPASVEVFKNAILGMSFIDAKGVLMGDSIAATSYLKTTTYDGLQKAFAPIIKEPLDLLKPNKFWEPIASNYNSIAQKIKTTSYLNSAIGDQLPYSNLPEDISKYLSEYATGEALNGLFKMVGVQESKLRADPWKAVSDASNFLTDGVGDLLGEVFSKAKDGEL
jgi:hypothetical protein